MFFSRNNIYTELKKEENIVLQFLNSDFASQGFNFNYVLLKKDEYNKFYGLTYVYDFLSPIDDIVPIVKKLNVNSWYQNTFWANRRTGLGFTIIGEGYVNFGILGIILSMFILAKITKYLYFNSNKNAYTFVIYLAFINYSMYACRGSLANIISPLFKYYILLAIILYHLPYFKIKDKIVYYKDKKINFLK